MKACRECVQKPWPYLIALFIATFSAFLTWLTLASAGVPVATNRLWSGGVFFVVILFLMMYMVSCLRRHCGHQTHLHRKRAMELRQ
jgi:hypothetical protein